MRRRRNVLVVLAVVVSAAGCGLTPGERIDKVEQAIVYYDQQADAVDATITDLETYLSGASIELQKAQAAGDDELMAKAQSVIDSITLKLQTARQQKQKLDDLIVQSRQRINDIKSGVDTVGLGDELKFYGDTITGASPLIPQPWGAVVGLVGTIIGGIGYGMKVRAGTAFEQVVAGNQKVLKTAETTPLSAHDIRDILSEFQAPATEAKVKKLKADIAK